MPQRTHLLASTNPLFCILSNVSTLLWATSQTKAQILLGMKLCQMNSAGNVATPGNLLLVRNLYIEQTENVDSGSGVQTSLLGPHETRRLSTEQRTLKRFKRSLSVPPLKDTVRFKFQAIPSPEGVAMSEIQALGEAAAAATLGKASARTKLGIQQSFQKDTHAPPPGST
ncbi:unnamed protein product [Linum trigynum]|uniref:Uncharacterized protein n=1 Tax=Linum trigynum TaxID=586398 RepID=A0AAV2GDT5_9ROSI